MSEVKKRKKRNRFRVVVTLFFIILALSAALAGALIYLRSQKPTADPKKSRFSLQSITVTGNNHYDDEAIIAESGLSVGQNILSVNKAAAAKKLAATFAYIDTVKVTAPTFNTVSIDITETAPCGAMYADGHWLVVGNNNKILELLPVTGDTPGRYFYLRGATAAGEVKLGAAAMDDRSLRITKTVKTAIDTYKAEGILGVDMRDRNNIALNWKNTLTVTLGNESNLDAEIAMFVNVLPQILERNGGSVAGRLDLSSYSDDTESNDRIVYTPQDVLENP